MTSIHFTSEHQVGQHFSQQHLIVDINLALSKRADPEATLCGSPNCNHFCSR